MYSFRHPSEEDVEGMIEIDLASKIGY